MFRKNCKKVYAYEVPNSPQKVLNKVFRRDGKRKEAQTFGSK